ncbi:hypothetical protein TNCV_534011 [Trichonephila clavipes]|nr:hypothetical protein TNCV_534011 [Trichonephila clavipes]
MVGFRYTSVSADILNSHMASVCPAGLPIIPEIGEQVDIGNKVWVYGNLVDVVLFAPTHSRVRSALRMIIRRESDYKLYLEPSENITQGLCSGVHNACSELAAGDSELQ